MEKGCHSQARSTFQDSIVLLKVASNDGSCDNEKRSKHGKVDVLVQRAMQRLAAPRRDTKDLGLFVTISDDACSSALLTGIGHGHSRFSQAILIRVEDYGRENHSERDMEVDSCLIMQNYAASLLYKRTLCKPRASKLDQPSHIATKILKLCLSMLARRYKETMALSGQQPLDVAHCHRMVAAAYVATYSLVQATLARPRTQPVTLASVMAQNDCCQRLQHLYTRLQMLDIPGSVDKSAAAA